VKKLLIRPQQVSYIIFVVFMS